MTWICPKCERELKSENATHYCARVSIDSLFEGKSAELVLVFDKLLVVVADWENIAISASPNCIVFVRNYTFLVVKPMKAVLDIKFYTQKPTEGVSLFKSFVHAGRHVNSVRISQPEQLTPALFKYIRESYRLL